MSREVNIEDIEDDKQENEIAWQDLMEVVCKVEPEEEDEVPSTSVICTQVTPVRIIKEEEEHTQFLLPIEIPSTPTVPLATVLSASSHSPSQIDQISPESLKKVRGRPRKYNKRSIDINSDPHFNDFRYRNNAAVMNSRKKQALQHKHFLNSIQSIVDRLGQSKDTIEQLPADSRKVFAFIFEKIDRSFVDYLVSEQSKAARKVDIYLAKDPITLDTKIPQ